MLDNNLGCGGGEEAPSLEETLPAVGGRCGVEFVIVATEGPLPVAKEGSPWVLVACSEPEPPLPGEMGLT